MLKEGDVVGGKYRIEHMLGEGGMGTVWVATNVVLERRVALKVMNERLARTPGAAERFQREAIAASRVVHPGIVQVFDASTHEGKPWIAMELLDGESLGARLERGPLPLAEVLRMASGVLGALAAVHDAGLIHRDIKPDNIFLATTRDGGWAPKLLDFGVAKSVDDQLSKLTVTGTLVGSACYLSPEQALGRSDVDARTDVYSMGVVVYECLAGTRPFEAETISQLVAKMFTDVPRPLRSVAPHVPEKVATVVDVCLEQDRDRRFRGAASFLAALESAAAWSANPAAWEVGYGETLAAESPSEPAPSARAPSAPPLPSPLTIAPAMRVATAIPTPLPRARSRTVLAPLALGGTLLFAIGAAAAVGIVSLFSDDDPALVRAWEHTEKARRAPLLPGTPAVTRLPSGVDPLSSRDADESASSEDVRVERPARLRVTPRRRVASAGARPRATTVVPPAPAPSRRVEPVRTARGLSYAQIVAGLSGRLSYLQRRCHHRRLRRVPGLRGVITIAWTIEPDGRVSSAEVARNDTGDDWLGRCTRNVVRDTRFAISPDGQHTVARHPFHFGVPVL